MIEHIIKNLEILKNQLLPLTSSNADNYHELNSDYINGLNLALSALKQGPLNSLIEKDPKLNIDTEAFNQKTLQMWLSPYFYNFDIEDISYRIDEDSSEVHFTVNYEGKVLELGQSIMVYSKKLDELPLKMRIAGIMPCPHIRLPRTKNNGMFRYTVRSD
jgi:hypothetical protein